MGKVIKVMVVSLIFITVIYADGPLRMKGFHHEIPFDKACKIMSTFKTDRGDFILNKIDKKCGFGRNGFISSPYITGNTDTNDVESIVLSPEVVDDLFNAKRQNIDQFANKFLNRYKWIDSFRTTRTYRKECQEHGWKLMINRKKWIKIVFYKRS